MGVNPAFHTALALELDQELLLRTLWTNNNPLNVIKCILKWSNLICAG